MPRLYIEYSIREVTTRHADIVLDVPEDKLRDGGARVDPNWVREQIDELGIEMEYDDCDVLEERLGGHEYAEASPVKPGTPTTAEFRGGHWDSGGRVWVRMHPSAVALLRDECYGRGTESCT